MDSSLNFLSKKIELVLFKEPYWKGTR